MSRVSIGLSPSEDRVPAYFSISKFLPILEDYADIWDVDIVAGRSHQGFPLASSSTGETVAVNFFHEEESYTEYRTLYGVKSFALGHVFKEEIRCLNVSLFRGSKRHEFYDFDDSLLAHTDDQSVNFDFDFLRTCWDGHEDVLRIILAWGLSQALSHTHIRDVRDGFAEYVKKQCAARVDEERSKFIATHQQIAKKCIQAYEEKLGVAVAASVENEARCVAANQELEGFIALDLDTIGVPSTEQFESDFERLRNLSGVARVEVADNIWVTTRRLEQICPPPSEVMHSRYVSKAYDIGSIKFSIDPSCDSFYGLTFRVHQAGAYRNAYLNGAVNICLGNNIMAGGMNLTIGKLLVKYKIPDVAALVLTFFRFVNTVPRESEKMPSLPELDDCDAASSLDECSEEDWKREKQAYVALMQRVAKKRGKVDRDAMLQELQVKQSTTFAALKKCWEAAAELELIRQRVKANETMREERAHELLDKLEKHPVVLGFDMHGGMRIWFNQKSVFLCPTLLWISEKGVARLISFVESYGQARNHAILWDWNGDTKAVEYIARGEYAELVSCVMQITNYWFGQMGTYQG